MKEWIKKDRIKFKLFSLERLNFFGLPFGLVAFSLISLYFIIIDWDGQLDDVNVKSFVFCLVAGLIGYFVQLRRLRFKKFILNQDLDEFKECLRNELRSNNWKIEYDNQAYLQATYQGSIFNLDMLTFRFKKSEIQYNLIRHPNDLNSIAALLTLNRPGRKLLKKIKTCA
jgi:hypothetical protein